MFYTQTVILRVGLEFLVIYFLVIAYDDTSNHHEGRKQTEVLVCFIKLDVSTEICMNAIVLQQKSHVLALKCRSAVNW